MEQATSSPRRVVIVGGGFGGLHVALSLRRSPVEIVLLDRRNFHLFQPLLYQVATGGLSPANVAGPLRSILRRQKNARVHLAEVVGFDAAQRKVLLADGEQPYDVLVVAAGASHSYFGRDEWEPFAPGLKTIEDAVEIRRRVLLAFETAERLSDPKAIRRELTFVVVGAGPTGVELAGAVAEMARFTLRHDFRSIDPGSARVVLVETEDRVLRAYHPSLSKKGERSLDRIGVEVRTQTRVLSVGPDSVQVEAHGERESIDCRTILWAAGVKASPLGGRLAEATGCTLDRAGRVVVKTDLSLPGYPEIFVIGDLAHVEDEERRPLPGTAPVAIQEGRYVSRLIDARARGKTLPPFRYRHPGNMATIGRAAAVFERGWLRMSGLIAWLGWLFVHLMAIVQFENRLLVFFQWAFIYLANKRTARLITGESAEILPRFEKPPLADPRSRLPAAEEPNRFLSDPTTPTG